MMKRFLSLVVTLGLILATQAFAVTATFTLSSAARTSAGIYDSNGVLVRTLWSNVDYPSGTHPADWNGLDDNGVLRPNGQYELRVLSNNVQYTWEGVIGNTSDSFTGPTVHHPLDVYFGMAVSGTTVYLASGYNEQITASFKTSTTNPQQVSKILSKGANAYHVATDGTYVYWAAKNPPTGSNLTFVYVTKTSDDTEASLASATSVAATHGRTYTSAINVVDVPGSFITGLAVQKTGDYLFVSRRALNRLDVLNKSTGALVHTLAFTSPGALAIDETNDLWMVTDDTLVTKYVVATDGTLTALGGVTTGLVKPLAVAISPDNSTVVVADGGSSQQLKAYTNSASPASVWTMGQAGGYANGPDVSNDKFYFRVTMQTSLGSDSLGPGGEWTHVAYQPDGKFWVGDPANYRNQRFNADRTFFDRLQNIPIFYTARVDQNDPTRVFAKLLEFSIDYSKPLSPTNGSWTLVRNWSWGVTGVSMDDDRAILRSVATLSNGRTYALMRRVAPFQALEVVELPPAGNLRFTGYFTGINGDALFYSLDKDGNLRTQTVCSGTGSPPVFNHGGVPIQWKMRNLNGFDPVTHNPQYGPLVTAVTSPARTPEDVCNTAGESYWEITSTGILLAFSDRGDVPDGWHMQGLDISTGQWKWKGARSTNRNYIGPYPEDGYFDTGNNGFSPYAGGGYHASGRHIFWEYHGEGWKQGQTNRWMHLYDDGLAVGQFGVTNAYVGRWLPEAAAGMAGNAFSSAVVEAADGSRYIYHNDENTHGGLHRWHVTGLDTIHEDSVPITLANTLQAGLQGTYYDGMDLADVRAATVRIDPQVDFNWGAAAPPGTSVGDPQTWSVKWQGFIRPRYTELYTFNLLANDGVRLWVNDKLVVDQWQDAEESMFHEVSGTISLEADKLYPIRLEYYQRYDSTEVHLSWSSASQASEIIPSSRLFYTDISDSPGVMDLLDGLRYMSSVSDEMYGWHRTPAEDVRNSWASDWWEVDTSRYVYRKDRPVDVRARFARAGTGTASFSRELRPAGPNVSTWTLSGSIAYGSNWNRYDYGQAYSTGHYLEVLDSAGRIIARMHPSGNQVPWIKILGNGNTDSHIIKLVEDWTTWGRDFVATPLPFYMYAADGEITFSYAGSTFTATNLVNPAANWQDPRTLRVLFFQQDISYVQEVGLSELTFSSIP